jgi:DNA polymerase elongation subunit (family B)
LYLDIETSPNIVYTWNIGYKVNISYENIIKERSIICVAYKFTGEKVNCLAWDSKQNDERIVQTLAKLFLRADEVIAHNGDRFDIAWIRTHCLKYNIPLIPLITLDTLKIARNQFRFNSNRLDYIAQYLGLGKKKETNFKLWKEVVDGNKKSLKKMVAYCKNDVLLLEKVWNRFSPYVKAKVSISENRKKCPDCEGKMEICKHRVMASGAKVTQLHCLTCGKFNTIPTKELC